MSFPLMFATVVVRVSDDEIENGLYLGSTWDGSIFWTEDPQEARKFVSRHKADHFAQVTAGLGRRDYQVEDHRWPPNH